MRQLHPLSVMSVFVEKLFHSGCKGLGKGDKVRFEAEYDDRKGKMRAVNVPLGAFERAGR